MPLPNKITIGPFVFSVSDAEIDHLRAVADTQNDTWGYIHYGKGTIVLNPDQHDTHKRLALLHEVMHGCWHMTDHAHEEDEDVIRRLAGPLLDVLRRNPDLVAYLLEE